MSRSGDYSELAGSLATVAIAALGGPLPAAGAALAEVVKHARARYDADAPTRDLRRQVTAEIRQWAASEEFAPEQVERGLALAAETVAQFGLDNEAIAAVRFDPGEAARRVLEAAKAKDPYWGTEDHYEVAARAIAVTYHVLIQQFRASEPLLLPAIQALRGSLDDYAARAESMDRSAGATLDDLAAALVAAGTVAEVMSYLQSRIADWDVSVWHPDQQAPSAIEQRLRVRTTDGEPSQGGPEVTAEEALAGQRMLVVLGGPGSGKTWLARRYAREAAQAALSRLKDGASLDEVELPLFTTWDLWTKTVGDTRQSLVAASFASGLGYSDPEATDSIGRLERTFIQRGSQVLLVVDSLDEAADLAGQATRLRELSSLHGWRVVVTSRQAAWDATCRGEAHGGGGRRVVELKSLDYPADVVAFVQAWFAAKPSRGDALLEQIEARDDLARVVVVPLMLTFYCLLTEEPTASGRPLPARRRDLYRRLVRRLLLGRWAANAPGPDAAPDLGYCEALLTEWAWHAVRDRITPTGLGDWGDSFTQPTPPREGERRAIDNVAPKITEDDEGQITRRFVHRTFLEHFVGEYFATLEAGEAAQIVLSHLWFDPDWDVAAPAAIVASNQRQRGTLFDKLRDDALQPVADPARQAAGRECDRLLLAVAQESDPADWTPEHAGLLHQCRGRNATSHPGLVARSAHWTQSNPIARAALLNAISTMSSAGDPFAAVGALPGLVASLLALGPTDTERAEARTAMRSIMRRIGPPDDWVKALASLAPSNAERVKARTELLNDLRTVNNWDTVPLVGALSALDPTDAERAEARTALLNTLSTMPIAEAPRGAGELLDTLSALDPTDAERAEARTALLDTLSTMPIAKHQRDVGYVMARLTGLGPTDAERAGARAALIHALSTTNESDISDLGQVLLALVTTDAELAEVRAALLHALRTSPKAIPALVSALSALDPTDADRVEARTALLNTLSTMPIAEAPGGAGELLDTLSALDPTDADRAAARTVLLNVLPVVNSWYDVARLTEALRALDPTDAERAAARTALINALPTNPWAADKVIEVLSALDPTDADRAEARTILLNVLSTTSDPRSGDTLVKALSALDPTDAERAEARTALLNVLPTVNSSYDVVHVAEALRALDPTDAERAAARTVLLNALPTDPQAANKVIEVLSALDPTDAEWAEARTALLYALVDALLDALDSITKSWYDVVLVAEALRALDPTDDERAKARGLLLNFLPVVKSLDGVLRLTEALRALDPTDAERAWARTAMFNVLSTTNDPTTIPYLVQELLPALNPTDAGWAEARVMLLNALASADDPDILHIVVGALPALLTTDADRAEARPVVLKALPAANPHSLSRLVAVLRSVSSVQSWLAWLNNGENPETLPINS